MKFRILLDRGCISLTIMRMLLKKLYPKRDDVMKWNKQAGNITTNLKFKIYFTLPELRATEIMMWNCHVDDSANHRYDMILGRDLLKELGLNPKFYEHVIKVDGGPLNGQHHPWLIWVCINLNFKYREYYTYIIVY